MITKVEINGYEITIEENEGLITVRAEKDEEVIEEFSIETEAQEAQEGEEMQDEEEEEESELGEMQDEEEEESENKLESFQSFINKKK